MTPGGRVIAYADVPLFYPNPLAGNTTYEPTLMFYKMLMLTIALVRTVHKSIMREESSFALIWPQRMCLMGPLHISILLRFPGFENLSGYPVSTVVCDCIFMLSDCYEGMKMGSQPGR